MKFEFKIDDNKVEPKVVRAMLMRGYFAFKAAFDDERKKQELEALRAEGSKTGAEEVQRHVQALEKLHAEEELWKQLLLSFTRSVE